MWEEGALMDQGASRGVLGCHDTSPRNLHASHAHVPCRHVGLALGGDDDAGVGVVKPILRQAHEGGVLFHQQYELGVGPHSPDLSWAWGGLDQSMPTRQNWVSKSGRSETCTNNLVDVGRDGLAAHAHSLAVDGVAVFLEGEAPHHHALFRSNHCKRDGGGGLGGAF